MEEEWVKLFEELGSYIASVSERENTASFNQSADIIFELDQYVLALCNLVLRIEDMDAFDGGDSLDSDMEGLKQDLTEMVEALGVILSDWVDREAGICCSKSHGPIEGVQIYRSGVRGRPKFIIPS